MSYRHSLLAQAEPLEPSEIRDLEEWLLVLKADCEEFGEAPEDMALINRIEDRIKEKK